MPKAAADHTTHDELLIARLYGDDLDDLERARALELVAGCDECSALYADLGAIAKATTALPLQSRPRDFALTEDDAARLRPRRRGWARLLGAGRRRSFGGALAALGFSGLVLTGALSMFGTVATSVSLESGMPGERFAAQAAAASEAQNFSASSAIPAPPATAGPAQPSAAGGWTQDGATQGAISTESSPAIPSPQEPGPSSSGAPEKGATPNASALAGGGAADTSTSGAPSFEQAPATAPQAGFDWRLLVLAGSGLLLAIGLVTLLGPAIRRRLRGGARP